MGNLVPVSGEDNGEGWLLVMSCEDSVVTEDECTELMISCRDWFPSVRVMQDHIGYYSCLPGVYLSAISYRRWGGPYF